MMLKNKNQPIFLSLTGLYMSGKSAAYDYLNSHENVFGISTHFDFDIIRLPYGINDLIYSIQNLSIHNYSYSIEKFIDLLNYFDGNNKNLYSKFFKYQCDYNYIFNDYQDIKNNFISANFSSKFNCHHPHSYPQLSLMKSFHDKLSRIFGNYPENCTLFRIDKYSLTYAIQKFVHELLISAKNYDGQDIYLLNNFNHIESLDLSSSVLENIFHVIVIRNPLDIYCSINSSDLIHNKNPDVSIRINDAETLISFLIRINYLFSLVKRYHEKGVLVITFEELISNPDLLKAHLEKSLNVSLGSLTISSLFDPSESRKSIGRWRFDIPDSELNSLRSLNVDSIVSFYPDLQDVFLD